MLPVEARSQALLTCNAVTAGYSVVPTVREISLTVEPGEIVTIIGPNGSGKSTFLKTVAGHLQIQSGEMELGGTELSRLPPERRAALGLAYVPQNDDVFSALTVQENLAVGGYLMPRRERQEGVARVMQELPQLGALRGRRALHLSGGERKLAALGRALVTKPRLLLLDEPTAGLAEPVANSLLRETVTGLRASGVGILLVEQRARLALEVAARAYVLVAGSIQHAATASSLLEGDRFATMFFKTSGGDGEDASLSTFNRRAMLPSARKNATRSLDNDRD